jgi:hypothetical protein
MRLGKVQIGDPGTAGIAGTPTAKTGKAHGIYCDG